MRIRETAISKLNQLPESVVREVNDFIDFVAHKHQAEIVDNQPDTKLLETWSQWFKTVDDLDITPCESDSTYPELLLNKYRQQGLDL